jgi:hypothetical protein
VQQSVATLTLVPTSVLQDIEKAGQRYLNDSPDHELANLLGPVSDISDAEVPLREDAMALTVSSLVRGRT